MSQEIQIFFDNGVFRPVDPTIVPEEGASFVLVSGSQTPRLEEAPGEEESELRRQRETLQEFFALAESLPLEVADDSFSGADHDRILYGEQG